MLSLQDLNERGMDVSRPDQSCALKVKTNLMGHVEQVLSLFRLTCEARRSNSSSFDTGSMVLVTIQAS